MYECGSAREILVHTCMGRIFPKTHMLVYRARGLKSTLSFHLHPYFVYASSEGSGVCAQLCRLA